MNTLFTKYARFSKLHFFLMRFRFFIIANLDMSFVISLAWWKSTNDQSLYSLIRPQMVNFEMELFGPINEGGYLAPTFITENDGLVSPGVNGEFKFDLDVTKNSKSGVLIDGSLPRPSDLPDYFYYVQKNLASEKKLNLLSVSLAQILDSFYSESNRLILQMDIEGGEYEVLQEISSIYLNKFMVIIVEFHDLNINLQGCTEICFKIMQDFKSVAINFNNYGGYYKRSFLKYPKVFEITFVRNDYFDSYTKLNLKKKNKCHVNYNLNNLHLGKIPYPA